MVCFYVFRDFLRKLYLETQNYSSIKFSWRFLGAKKNEMKTQPQASTVGSFASSFLDASGVFFFLCSCLFLQHGHVVYLIYFFLIFQGVINRDGVSRSLLKRHMLS